MFGRKKKEYGRQLFESFQLRMVESKEIIWQYLPESLEELQQKSDEPRYFVETVNRWLEVVTAGLVFVRLRESEDKTIVKSAPYLYQELIDKVPSIDDHIFPLVYKMVVGAFNNASLDEIQIELGVIILGGSTGKNVQIDNSLAIEVGKHVFVNSRGILNDCGCLK